MSYLFDLTCPVCNYEFGLDELYVSDDCENCGLAEYYWDYELDEETNEENFSGYYWSQKSKSEIRDFKLKSLGI